MTSTPITFVGLGAIGMPMAARLVATGHDVVGVDPFEAARDRATVQGIESVSCISGSRRAEVVIVMVATPDHLAGLVDEAVARTSIAGQIWVIMSTVGPNCITEQGARLVAAGATVVDAPVTGGVARAITGELVIFGSGASEALVAVTPVLEQFGCVRAVGDTVGQGQGIKVVNQHLCSVHIVAAAEALALAASLGLDQASVLDLVKDGAAASWMLSDRGPRMLLGTDAPVTSTIGIFVKDSGLVAAAASASGASVPLLDIARARYEKAAAAGLGTRDDSRVIETY